MEENKSSQVVTMGILSTANIARKVAKAANNSSLISVEAVCSRTVERAEEFAKDLNIPTAYGSYQELIDDESINLVYIPLPSSLHKEFTIYCAEKGKHVLCEKPTAPTFEDLLDMVNVCNANNVQFMDGTMWTHSLRNTDIVKHFDSIGPITTVNAKFSWACDDTTNIRLIKDLEPLGALGDLGWYCIRALLFGFNYELPEKVFGHAHYLDEATQGPISFVGTVWYADGRIGHFDASFQNVTRQYFEIAGMKGTICVDDFVVPWASSPHEFGSDAHEFSFDQSYTVHTFPGVSVKHTVVVDPVHEQQMVEDMAKIIQSGKLDPFWPEIALKTQLVLNTLLTSSEKGCVQDVPKNAYNFTT